MKRFLLFAWTWGDGSAGGWNDFVSSFDTEAHALEVVRTLAKNHRWHIVDTTYGEISGQSE